MTARILRILARGERTDGRSRFRTPLLLSTVTVAVAVSTLTVVMLRSNRPELQIDFAQRKTIDALENVLLHDSLTPQYERVVNQFDGRGFVAGIADFATADGGALEVVATYTARVGGNELARTYLNTLHELAQQHSDDTAALVGFPDAWRQASVDSTFRTVQADVRESRDYQPALRLARDLGLSSPLGLTVIYDTLLQHGSANQPDSLPALIERTNARLGGSPRTVPERDWLASFLDERRTVLSQPSEAAHQAVWPLSTGRVDALAALLAAHRDNLTPPLEVNPYGTAHTIGEPGADAPYALGVGPSDGRSPGSAAASRPTTAATSAPAPPATRTTVASPRATLPATRTSRPRLSTTPPSPVKPQAQTVVRIVNVNSGKTFGVDSGSIDDGAGVVQNGSPGKAQQWRLTNSPAGCFTLINMNSGKAFDNPDGTAEWGRWMQQWSAGPPGNPNQSWCFDSAGSGAYVIRSLASGLVLDLKDGGYFDGNPIQQWGGSVGNPNQLWTLELVQ